MLKLIQAEFLKLRRRPFIWILLLAALVMPFFAFLYFRALGKTNVEPIMFYKWSAFGFTMFIILPFILGLLSTMLMHDENQYDMLKQLWMIPVGKMAYFFSKFVVVLMYSLGFMLVTAVGSVLFGGLSGCVNFEWSSTVFLFEKCFEIGFFSAFAMLPILAVAASQKGYILPVCLTLIYALLGFFIMPVNMYLHPIASVSAIVVRNGEIPGLALNQVVSVPFALLCIGVWSVGSVVFANVTLNRRK